MSFTTEHDKTPQKKQWRRTFYKQCRRHHAKNILATNFPHELGMKFVHKLAGSGSKITLVDKDDFTKEVKKSLGNIVTLVPHTDIFYQMLSNNYDIIGIDICNGLAEDDVKFMEASTSWKVLVLTISNRFRSKYGKKPAIPTGTHVQQYITELCERNSWGCELSFAPKPYKQPNKREKLGIPDARGPWYFTFVITRK